MDDEWCFDGLVDSHWWCFFDVCVMGSYYDIWHFVNLNSTYVRYYYAFVWTGNIIKKNRMMSPSFSWHTSEEPTGNKKAFECWGSFALLGRHTTRTKKKTCQLWECLTAACKAARSKSRYFDRPLWQKRQSTTSFSSRERATTTSSPSRANACEEMRQWNNKLRPRWQFR